MNNWRRVSRSRTRTSDAQPCRPQRPVHTRCVVATALLAASLLAGCRRSEPGGAAAARPSASIILIVIDTLRADHLGCYGYFRETSPRIDAFARQSVVFDRAYATMATTLPSHTSMLTGLYPLEHGVLANVGNGGAPFHPGPGLRSIVELARAAGYRTAAFVSCTPLKRVGGLDVGFETYDTPPGAERNARQTAGRAIEWIRQHAGAPLFLFVHFFDPHFPYRPPPKYANLFHTDEALRRFLAQREVPPIVQPGLCRGRVATVTAPAVNRYDGEIRFCDHHVGRLLDALRDAGLWETSVIVLAADHGEGLNQHHWPQHGRTWDEQVHVPLMIHFPASAGVAPRRVGSLVSLIDVFPTVLGHVESAWASGFLRQARGRNVLSPDFRPRPLLSQRSGRDCGEAGGPAFVLTTPRWRYHYVSERRGLLFERASDPFELHDVSPSAAEQAAALRRDLLDLVSALRRRGEALRGGVRQAAPLDSKLMREMQALGYVGDEPEEAEAPASRPASVPAASRPRRP